MGRSNLRLRLKETRLLNLARWCIEHRRKVVVVWIAVAVAATLLAIFLIPVMFYVVERFSTKKAIPAPEPRPPAEEVPGPAGVVIK